jgi:hypothetical protein
VENSSGNEAAPATIEASNALPLCCNTSHGNAISEIPLPAAAAKAANRMR